MRNRYRLVAAGAVAVFVAACGGDDAAPQGPSSPRVSDAVIGATQAPYIAALYLVIEQQGGDDEVVGVTTSRGGVSVMRSTTPMDEQASMPGFPIDLADGSSVEFVPGGDHLMLQPLTSDLVEGDVVEITIDFARADDVVLSADVISPSALLDWVPTLGEAT